MLADDRADAGAVVGYLGAIADVVPAQAEPDVLVPDGDGAPCAEIWPP